MRTVCLLTLALALMACESEPPPGYRWVRSDFDYESEFYDLVPTEPQKPCPPAPAAGSLPAPTPARVAAPVPPSAPPSPTGTATPPIPPPPPPPAVDETITLPPGAGAP